MYKEFFQSSVCLAVGVLIAGCGAIKQRAEVYQTVYDGAVEVRNKIDEVRQDDLRVSSSVREINGVWLGGKTIKVSREAELPSIFSQAITFQFPGSPSLDIVADRISKIVGINVFVAPDAYMSMAAFNNTQKNKDANGAGDVQIPPVQGGFPTGSNIPSMGNIGDRMGLPRMAESERKFILDLSSPYNGTLADLLDQLSARYAVGWDYENGSIYISKLVTRTYQVASLIDKNEMSATVSKSGSTSSNISSSGSGSGTESVGGASSTTSSSSSVTGAIDIEEGFKKSIESALTPSVGKFAISQFGVVTVTDTREVQERIKTIINAENKAIGRQIRLRMVMVEVEASEKNDTGFDINAAISAAANKWNVNFVSPGGMLGGGGENAGQIGILGNGSRAEISQFIKMLSDVGRVSVKKDESYTLMNNRPLSMAQVENFIYPSRSTPAQANALTGVSGSVGVEPGQLTTGNFLNLRASILPNGSVIVQFSLDSSRRSSIETYQSNGTTLQYPQTTGGNYQTYVSIPNGKTGVVAAIDSTSLQSQDRSLDASVSPLLGGGMYNLSNRKYMMVLLTPYIIEGAG